MGYNYLGKTPSLSYLDQMNALTTFMKLSYIA